MTSEPPSASVNTSNGFTCEATPCTFKMAHNAEFDVTISKAGYKPFHAHVIHQVSTAGGVGMAGNVILGGLIGVGIDAASGAMMELKPNPLNVTLEAAPPPPVATKPAPAPDAAAPTAAAGSGAPAPAAPAAQ